MKFYQFKNRVKSLFRKKGSYDPFESLFSIRDNVLSWTCKVCNRRQSTAITHNNEKLIVHCEGCNKKHFISGSSISIRKFLFSSKEDVIYVTNATATELKAKIKNDSTVQIRERLVYHIKYDCELASKNYEYNGEIIAMNSGVIKYQFHDILKLCEGCAGVEYYICPRCGGKGIFKKYMHVSNGICFRCGGKGYDKIIRVEIQAE